ncbi:MAG: ferrous iron transport protein B [Clostridia bacterium]|nr:ferrous iron transport protein B [Clostridia bacterium]
MEQKTIRIALAGNPNAGKTTLFNALTGSNQFVGNWPGVTVEKKAGKLIPSAETEAAAAGSEIIVTDLPGIYSLSPYTPEEMVARNYLVGERPDAILNIVDGTNIERNLYLTTQLTEIGIPVVVAINMMDVVRKNKDTIRIDELARRLGCRVVEISALKETGIEEAAIAAIETAKGGKTLPRHTFSGSVEHAIAHIEEAALHSMPAERQRWYAIKIFERDDKVLAELQLDPTLRAHIEEDILAAEAELDDDAESIITNERYNYVTGVIAMCCERRFTNRMTPSQKIDRVLTNRFAALPIFAVIIFLVYYISVSTVGTWVTDFTNDGLFGDGFYLFGISAEASDHGIFVPGVPVLVARGLAAAGTPAWLNGLILDGIVGGVGAVLGFVPQMLVLFLFLAFLEACGYMARIAFVLDRVFRKFGLSGKSFIPMLVGTGCSVPGIMASRTIENLSDRRMTVITTSFIPCGAKLPVIALIASSLFGGAWWVAPSAYFAGIAAVVISGIILKKTRPFTGEVAPFVMELPAYHMPTFKNLMRAMWERGWSFIKKAGTVILLASIFIWAGSSCGIVNGRFAFDPDMALESSLLGLLGGSIAWLFTPLGFGNIKAAVATLMGLMAKEEIVGVFGVLDFEGLTPLSGYSFLLFNLLCAPCFAAMGAIRREMNSARWTAFAILYQCTLAYAVSLMVYQFGLLWQGQPHPVGLTAAAITLLVLLFMVLRPASKKK